MTRARTTAAVVVEEKWDHTKISRGTKCFSPSNNGWPGGYPNGYLAWCKSQGWWGETRAYLCCGGVKDLTATRVDVNPKADPTHLEDARKTSLPDNHFDIVFVDPPYSRDLAKELYQTEDVYSSVNVFAKEAERIVKPGGLIVTLTYEVPKRLPGSTIIACWGLYQAINVARMRCHVVFRKKEAAQ